MFVVAEIAGKQYQVSEKDKFLVDKLEGKEGDKIVAGQVLLYVLGNNVEVGTPYLPYQVELKVLGHKKGDKIRVFKMKAKKRYAKTQGHRQEYTEVEVVKIGKGKAPKVEADKPKKAEKKKEVEKKETTAKTPKKSAEKKVEKK